MKQYKGDAQVVADIVMDTPTELRGILFDEIAKRIKKQNQYYTASLFRVIADRYGYEKDDTGV